MTGPQRAVDQIYDVGRFGSEFVDNVTREMRTMPTTRGGAVGWRGMPAPLHPQVEAGGQMAPRSPGLLNRIASGVKSLIPTSSTPAPTPSPRAVPPPLPPGIMPPPVPKHMIPPPTTPAMRAASYFGEGKLAQELSDWEMEKEAFLGATFSLGAKGVGRLAKPLAAKLPAGVNRAVSSGVAKTEKGLGLVDNALGSSHTGMDMARRSSLSNMGY
jgi:hypothetical protein